MNCLSSLAKPVGPFTLLVLLLLTAAAAVPPLRVASAQVGAPAADAGPARGGVAGAKAGGAAKAAVEEIKEARLGELLRRDGGPEGARPLLVNFWATWCEPCRKEFPDLVLVDDEFRPRGLEFITISLDDVSEIGASVPQFLREMKAERLPAYLLNADDPEQAIRLVDSTWHGELPATFLYDRQGRLVYKHMGRINREELRTAVKKVISDQ